MRIIRSILVSTLCASFMLPALQIVPARAATLPKPGIASDANVIQVQRRRGYYGNRRYYGYRGRGYRGPNPGAVFGAIVAGALIAAAIREGRASDDDLIRCEEEFRSFDRETGTYITHEGEERICPYLR